MDTSGFEPLTTRRFKPVLYQAELYVHASFLLTTLPILDLAFGISHFSPLFSVVYLVTIRTHHIAFTYFDLEPFKSYTSVTAPYRKFLIVISVMKLKASVISYSTFTASQARFPLNDPELHGSLKSIFRFPVTLIALQTTIYFRFGCECYSKI